MTKSSKPVFPPARVKRIMQSDSDIGKLAQSTPVATAKALEIFLKDLVETAAKEASDRGATKVGASHFKAAIVNTPKFDFLKDSVASVPDPVDADEAKAKKPKKPRAPRKPKAKADPVAKDDPELDADMEDQSAPEPAEGHRPLEEDDNYDD